MGVTEEDTHEVFLAEQNWRGNFSPCSQTAIRNVCRPRKDTFGIVAKDEKLLVGYLFWTLSKDEVMVGSIGVHPEYRRCGIGSLLLTWLLERSPAEHRRPRTVALVRESNLPAQLFLKHHDFRCERILKDVYDHPKEQAYAFVLRRGEGND